MPEVTPMMRQYFSIKERNTDCILFFRLGDFYEMFGDDALTASKELDLTLTSRDRRAEDPDEKIPMCGVPYHSAEGYIGRLIAKGYKIAICEQLEDPATAKGLVDRDIVRIVTPGTLIESSMLDEGKSNYLCALYVGALDNAACFADLSTGEISVSYFSGADVGHLLNEVAAFSPAEAVLNAGAYENGELHHLLSDKLGCLWQQDDGRFDPAQSLSRIAGQFGVTSADEAGIGGSPAAVCAVGALLSYMADTQKTDLSHLSNLRINSGGKFMELDIQTLRSLELVSSSRTLEKKGSLLWVLDKTKTPMGRRLLRSWVLRPLVSTVEVGRRLAAVEELFSETVLRSELMLTLRNVGDMERLIGKIVYGTAGGRDLKALQYSIVQLPKILALLAPMKSGLMAELKKIDDLQDIGALIAKTIEDDPPFSVREGGFIRQGVSEEVDYLRGLLKDSTGAMAAIETKERERTGKKLKVGYNKVFGYYIEIPRALSDNVPGDYIRKQTLSNCERFITQELKELETTLLTAKDRVAALEYEIFADLRERIASEVGRIQATSYSVASFDALCSLAETAAKNNYCMPEVDMSGVIDIRDGRHPVVEKMQTESLFVPNDTFMDMDGARTLIITGPNMAGKSTYMRQTALIVLMAQMGSFVPARSARIGVVDRVFTRIGASDDLSAGKSTFMVEMTEVAEILKSATSRSLLILDEIGRGTSTYDGMAVARAVLEYCTDRRKLGAKALFSTHYHELTAIEKETGGVKNYSISAKKRGGDIIFLRKIVPGGADDSYGIEVAGLAGIPDSVIKRAKAVLAALESDRKPASAPSKKPEPGDGQMTLLDLGGSEIAETLKKTDLNTLTPLEALNLLFELKKKI
ncbi:DNA mismatch repair protein MutS [Sporobacter termitidis DSM 10068]|uniref:DNA mismatch repair protein MutS n=1 Tax=Sporobacter termitidis DSM 10068 TaxID=1123282 RepID=A0A1M5Z4A4_9FIRM|nr:DNA mismatch repair protein MutS [Sporobacter termitidis]SHI19106.1 DNA mismatch repair protein MutS [Sporobacter termitidis DSM 10068]